MTRWYMVRDLGASLGKFTYPTVLRWFRLRGFGQGTRNDLPGFEQQGFIEEVDDGSVDFDYRGIYRDVISTVTPSAGPVGMRAVVAADGSAVGRRVSQRRLHRRPIAPLHA